MARFVNCVIRTTTSKIRYTSFLSSPFSISNHTNLNEQSVLNELNNLLPTTTTTPKPSFYKPFTPPPVRIPPKTSTPPPDHFLSPAEKLRGIFLQKLIGKSAIESALSAVNVNLTLEIVGDVVNKGNLGGKSMLIFFNWVIRQKPEMAKSYEIWYVIVKALGRRKFFYYMELVLGEMKGRGMAVDSEVLYIVMDSYLRGRRVAKAFEMFGRLEEFGRKPDTEGLNLILRCLCRRGHVGTASSFFRTVKGKIGFDLTTFNVVIGGWAKVGRVSEVERFMREMVVEGLEPDCLSFSYLVECLGRDGRVNDAVGVFRKLEEKGCVPDTVVYNAVIENFVSVGELDEGRKYLLEMIGKNCSPDVDSYALLIGAFIKNRRVADSLELFDEMLDRGILPSTGTVTSFLEPLCSFGPPHAAMMIYTKARKVGCRISVKGYKLLLMRLSRFGKCGMVLKVWNEMQSCGYDSDMEVYEYVVNGLCNIGQLDSAILVMEEALHKGFCPGKIIYSKLNNKLLNCNKVDKAYKLFLKVKEARRCENARRYWHANGWHF